MDDSRRNAALRMVDYYRRGIFTADEACARFLFFRVEPALAAEYVGLLTVDLQGALEAFLLTLPDSDEGWAGYQGVGQLDGDEWSWVQTISDCRANTEAVRYCLLGQTSAPAAADFVDRIRAAYHKMLDDFLRSVALRRGKHAEPNAAPDPAT
jgi:hypothetical protein